MYAFQYRKAKTLQEAADWLAKDEDAKALSGGMTLLPTLKARLAQPSQLIDIAGLAELAGIENKNGVLTIGAATRYYQIATSPVVREVLPALAALISTVADPQVRNRGTIGGDIAHGDPGNDHPALSIALNASFVLEGPGGRRTVAADGFFLGTYMTLLQEEEVMCEIHVPAFAQGTGWAYEKLKRKTGDWATAGCAVVMRKSGNTVSEVRIALTNVGPTALRAESAEQALLGKELSVANLQAAADAACAICDPAEDLRGDIEYKTAMAGQMVKRALTKAFGRCQ